MADTDIYLSAPQVLQRYNISDMTLWRWLQDDELDFPKPMTIRRRRFFREAELVEWERLRAKAA